MISFLIYTFLGINVIVSILLTLLVMMQRPKAEGLGAAFGGSVTDSIFGAQTSDVLTKLTIYLGGIFFVITLLLATLYSHRSNSKIHQELLAPAAVTAPAVPAETQSAPVPATPAAPAADQKNQQPEAPAKAEQPAAKKK